ncbi:aminotransferase class III-fold pyridoxal phosphate-dependent enzyme [Anaerovorax odorimutans]|uniref:Aminotransferase class III-fold pyridoxal phosphate-dependent enzyme n=1 Tax=Anaerovorax odorimutans TaxID=109327 RepID=A0ABT1RJ50_9FIRM|nr:aminotransferase class III-fold pyridoxal phosphate-dependent enzyme [Anaerovorax odorimutans]MCQ4635205.1 aminotransferase class III-fold pyridoxal phosphate-dependent enzyme [Anaerovorax odorimutans]
MTATNKELGLEIAKRVEGYIQKDQLSQEDVDTILKESEANYNENVNPGWLPYREIMSTDPMFSEWSQREGEFFSDVKGTEFIDCLGGFGIFLAGHKNTEIMKTVHAQLDRYPQHSQDLVNPLQGYFSHLMGLITPGDLQAVWPTNGGTEATEAAIKLSKLATGGKWFISTVNAYHGLSTGALSLIGNADYRSPFVPNIQQVQHVKYGDAEQMENAIANLQSVGEKVAAVILEPIQGEGGIIIPPAGYLKKVREICDKYGVAMICDEIQTGLGRTGALWRTEAEGIVPDILLFGKAIGGGCMPLTGIIARPWMVTEALVENPTLVSMPTFGGNPLAMSAGIASIRYILENDIPQLVKEKGEYFLKKLNEIQKKYPEMLKEVRGTGLMIGLVLPDMDIMHDFCKEMFSRKVMTSATMNDVTVARIEPCAAISYESIDKVCEVIEESIKALMK